jgi:hypothetical protein
VPFRRAHERIGHAVQYCVERGCELEELTLDELREFSADFGEDVYEHLKLEAVINCHDVPGGTAAVRVREALGAARRKLGALSTPEDRNAGEAGPQAKADRRDQMAGQEIRVAGGEHARA